MSRLRTVLAPTTAVLLAASISGVAACSSSATVGSSSPTVTSSSASLASSTPVHRRSAKRQSAKIFVHPQMAQPGKGAAPADKARSVISSGFKPAAKGRPVLLQRKKGSGWATVSKSRQNGRGVAEFTAPYAVKRKVQTYRVVAAQTAKLAKVTSKPSTADKWGAPDFSDEFDGAALGPDWTHRLQGYAPQSKRKCSQAGAEAVAVSDGTAQLSVINDPTRGANNPNDVLNGTETCHYDGAGGGEAGDYEWRLNGHIGTQGLRSFTYGYAAARVKFQPLRGQHASFWLQPEAPEAAEGPATKTGAEIDIIEWFGEDHPSGGLTSFIYHYPDDGKPGVTAEKVGGFIKKPARFGGDWASKFHVFSVEWTPQRYVFRIDGKETYRTSKGVSGKAQFLILSLLSSDYELGFLDGDKNLPQTMDVDWVRYWER